jgi:hypothetical protein
MAKTSAKWVSKDTPVASTKRRGTSNLSRTPESPRIFFKIADDRSSLWRDAPNRESSPAATKITGGDAERLDSEDGQNWHVSTIQLVSRLQALFHAGDLRIAKPLPEATVLATELQDFRACISEAGYASFGARIGKHDDLVLRLALACWQLVSPWRNRHLDHARLAKHAARVKHVAKRGQGDPTVPSIRPRRQ